MIVFIRGVYYVATIHNCEWFAQGVNGPRNVVLPQYALPAHADPHAQCELPRVRRRPDSGRTRDGRIYRVA